MAERRRYRDRYRSDWELDAPERLQDIRRSAFLAGIEALAGITSAARVFLDEVAAQERVSRDDTWEDVVRDLPETLDDAASVAFDEAFEIPHRTVDKFYDEYNALRSRRSTYRRRTSNRNSRRD